MGGGASSGAVPAWDRERDLQAHKFNPTSRKDVAKSAAALHSRFAPARH